MNLNIPELFIKVNRGSCPYCGGIVRMIESEMTESVLKENGDIMCSANLSYSCIGYCTSCDKPVYIDPTGMGYVTLPYTDTAIDLHDSIKRVLGDNQGVLRTDIPITLDTPKSEFIVKE